MTSQDSASGAGAAGLVRHRHVFYIEGYDPQGAVGYHRLFGRELKRFMATWGVKAEAGDIPYTPAAKVPAAATSNAASPPGQP